jgi:hypothetical protein
VARVRGTQAEGGVKDRDVVRLMVRLMWALLVVYEANDILRLW